MKKLVPIILSGLAPITILTTASLASCGKQAEEKLIHDSTVYFKTPALADTITVIDLSGIDPALRDDMNTTFQSLQGLIVQRNKRAELFVKSGVNERDKWFYDMQYKYHFHTKVVNSVKTTDASNIWGVLSSYRDLFNRKYIEYVKANAAKDPGSEERENISINNATMISACEYFLMVSDQLLKNYAEEFATLEITPATPKISPSANASEVFNTYKDELNKTMLLNQDPVDFALRDYAIAAKIPVVCVGLLDEEVRNAIADQMKPNSPIFGWSHGFDGEMEGLSGEQPYLIWATQHKFNVLASDHCYNLSFYSYDKTDKVYKQHEHRRLSANPNKHYLAIVMSDGDNIQWMQNDFLRSGDYWGSPYRGEFPLSWTISPTPIDLNNSIMEELYATATDNDELIAGPSGYAYINPAWYYQEKLMDDYNAFAKRTAEYMHDCDLTIANPLDFRNPDWVGDHGPATKPEVMTPYMQQDQIKGLIWSLDSLSLDGHGSIDWINNKPLLSFREGIWGNDGLKREDVLARIKTYPRDIHKIDGYTALVVNVWGDEGKMNKIKEFVDQLPDDVELVTISQLLQLINDNVPHVHAVPEKHAEW